MICLANGRSPRSLLYESFAFNKWTVELLLMLQVPWLSGICCISFCILCNRWIACGQSVASVSLWECVFYAKIHFFWYAKHDCAPCFWAINGNAKQYMNETKLYGPFKFLMKGVCEDCACVASMRLSKKHFLLIWIW